ncbi:glycosyltransferase [Caenimonas koreensis DSM 17982]|uniref:Glycosyltransferase n=1 Tax=Caenimonas koreensis DSM 17982 TaxID=1121255 RepID=A0A844B5Q0_9BURK|nr:glycosyltransferase [Caenimonas koreensis]MRD46827.1 glycosyltransferase [Caenimonas koreensis DSM 17982]
MDAAARDASAGRIGLVCPSTDGRWLGGLYYLQHLVLAVAELPPHERINFVDVWWNEAPEHDPFSEIREHLGPRVVVGLPQRLVPRIARAVKRRVLGAPPGMSDLFEANGIGVLFPSLPCEEPGVPYVCWLADLQHRHLTQYYTPSQLEAIDATVIEESGKAALMMLSSHAAMQDLEKYFPRLVPKARVVFPVSVPTAEWFACDPAEVANRLGLPERFLMVSNQICAHKNHAVILEAVRRLHDEGTRVTVVCTGLRQDYRDLTFYSRLQARVDAMGLADQMLFVGALPRAEQLALMRRAVGVAQPSEFEGWGSAMSDAKVLGRPILASDLPVHREHRANVLAYLDPHDVDGWSREIRSLWLHGSLGPDLEGEARALESARQERLRVGRETVALFREAMG